jgi:hypothetical protein
MVHSHIVYCINIYSCANTKSLNRLRIKQKQAVRIICNAGFRDLLGLSVKLGSPTENEIPIENFVMPMIYIYLLIIMPA